MPESHEFNSWEWLNRVTGNNVSNILGTLGVDGAASLFLLNPNGIVFGNNAQLDIEGSFFSTTANSLVFGDGSEFSAANPNQPPLLKVSTPLGLQYGANSTGAIANSGNLAVPGDLTIAGVNLDLQGQLLAGEDLRLQAQKAVEISDSVTQQFIAAAGGELVIQGNESVDILALNHPDSGLFAGGNLLLRSPNSIAGDAHYWSGGSFRVEKLDGSLGDLESPYDPVIRSFGDVSFNNYFGASLHILAGGSVNIGTVIITAPETGIVGDNFLVEEITLSDGTLVSINGGEQPTLDVRAGVSPEAIGTPGITGFDGFPTDFFANAGFNFLEPPPETNTAATSADITISGIGVSDPDGVVLLTNQYQPNTSLPGGSIEVGTIRVDDTFSGFTGNSGSVIIDSRDQITITNRIDTSSDSGLGRGGEIKLLANGDISLINGALVTATGNGGGGIEILGDRVSLSDGSRIFSITTGSEPGRDVLVNAKQLTLRDASAIGVNSRGDGQGGNLTINASELVEVIGGQFESVLAAQAEGKGNAGNLIINTSRLLITNGAEVSAITLGEGAGGNLTVNATELVQVIGRSVDGRMNSFLDARTQGKGNAGNLTINTSRLLITDGAQVGAGTFGEGDGGSILINATNTIFLDSSGIFSSVEPQAKGNAGGVEIETNSLSLINGAVITASTRGEGDAGSVLIRVKDNISLDGEGVDGSASGIFSRVNPGAQGNAGGVEIETGSLLVTNGAVVDTSTFGEGNGGSVLISATDTVYVDGEGVDGSASAIASSIQSEGKGNGGDVEIETGSLSLTNGALITASTLEEGDAGSVLISATDTVSVDGEGVDGSASAIASSVALGAKGDAGNVEIETGSLSLTNGAQISADTRGEGNAGSVVIRATDTVFLDGEGVNGLASRVGSSAQPRAKGSAGGIEIETALLLVTNGALIDSATFGEGDSGSILIRATDTVALDGERVSGNPSGIFNSVEPGAKGNAGGVEIEAGSLYLTNGAVITASTIGKGNAGSILIRTTETISLDGEGVNGNPSGIFSSVESGAKGNGGGVEIEAGSLYLTNGAQIGVGTSGEGNAGFVLIRATDTVSVDGEDADGNNSGVFSSVETGANGNGGAVEIETGLLSITNGALIDSATFGEGDAGSVLIRATDTVALDGEGIDDVSSGVFSSVQLGARGKGGGIEIETGLLSITNGAVINTSTLGEGNAGDILITVEGKLSADDSNITTQALVFAGGAIEIDAGDIRLFGDSDIRTNVAIGTEGGGNITLTADSIIAFDDSDILAFARDGAGGNITFNTPAFFGENYRPAPEGTNPATLDGNNRVDINASGRIDGVITLPDVSFIQNSLTDLQEALVNPDSLIAGSCIIPTNEQQGSLYITGAGGLPTRPGDVSVAPYPTGIVKPIGNSSDSPNSVSRTNRRWQKGDPIIEPTGVYQLPDGRLVMGRECSQK
ncbi:MAG: filamentous hemagglutinin N-terminal domain-containing protein [Symploca sp. SIO3C6]|nr:filamentous hemagglutinin N-terminal domain-containing protein [Symploca sp. SIO3C6]